MKDLVCERIWRPSRFDSGQLSVLTPHLQSCIFNFASIHPLWRTRYEEEEYIWNQTTLRGRFPMHALATAKAGSLGDERYDMDKCFFE